MVNTYNMKLVSFNVNGLRSITSKGSVFKDLIVQHTPDILCLQEIRCNNDVATKLLGEFWNEYPYIYYNTSKTKKGYSGTAILSKEKPVNVTYDLPGLDNDEGRVITCEFSNGMHLVNVYTPNSGSRYEYRVDVWDTAFRDYIKNLTPKKVIVCGDLNVARGSLDIYDDRLTDHAGFTIPERTHFETFLHDCKLVDTFRELHPELCKYSFWSNLGKMRMKGKGWRIDYVLVSRSMIQRVKVSDILSDCMGSDHAPVYIELG